jgi:LysM repeat protein
MTRYARPAPTSRLRDFLVMAGFSLAALAAAFALVHFKYGGGKAELRSIPAAEPATQTAAPPEESAKALPPPAAPAPDAQALSKMRADLERVRGDLEAANARISKLNETVQKLQAAPTPDRGAKTDAPALSRAEPSTRGVAQTAGEPTGKGETKKDAAPEREQRTSAQAQSVQYVVHRGDTLAKIADDFCLPLADLLRLNQAVRDPKTLHVDQVLLIEDRCVAKPRGRAVAN